MLVIGHGTKGYPDSYIRFKRIEDIKSYLAHSSVASARFRAKDFVNFQTSESEINGVSHNDRQNLTIETPAMIDFNDNDIIYDLKYQLTWRIAPGGVVVADDGQMKENSMRPRKLSRLTLIR